MEVRASTLDRAATHAARPSSAALLDGARLHVLAWGDDGAGQCLGGARSSAEACVPRPTAVRLPEGRSDFSQLGAGWEQSFFVSHGGSLWAGGSNRAGCLSGDGAEQVLGLQPLGREDAEDLKAAAVASGREHFVAIRRDGASLATWGCSNEFGQTGQGGEQMGIGPCPLRSFAVQPGVKIHSVACGQDHALALTERGEVFAWGDNMSGQLGRSSKSATPFVSTPQRVEAGALRGLAVRQIAAGAHHSLVLGLSGQVAAWGCNRRGRLGLGSGYDEVDMVSLPMLVADLPGGVRSVAGGGRHSAVVLRKGVVLSAGDNRSGQLGQDPAVLEWSGTFIELDFADAQLQVRAVALGEAHSLFLTYTGELFGVGGNDRGQLGEPVGACWSAPRRVDMPNANWIIWAVAAGPGHSLVLATEPPCVRQPPSPASPPTSGLHSPKRMPRAGSAPTGASGAVRDWIDEGEEEEAPLARTVAYHGFGAAAEDTDEKPLERLRSIGCASKLANSGKLVIPVAATGSRAHDSLLISRPVVRPGVALGVGFMSLSVEALAKMVQDVSAARLEHEAEAAQERLRTTVAAVLRLPTVLSSCFQFPGTNEARLDAGGLCAQLLEARRLSASAKAAPADEQWAAAALQGVRALAPSGGLLRNMRTRDQVRALVVWLLVPNWPGLFADFINQAGGPGAPPAVPRAFEAAQAVLETIARLPADGRAAFRDVVAEECSDMGAFRDTLLAAARALANASLRSSIMAHKLQKPIWEAVLLLQLLWIADARRRRIAAAAAQAAVAADQTAGGDLGSLGRSLSRSASMAPSASRAWLYEAAAGASAALPPSCFEISGLVDMRLSPVYELQLFTQNASSKVIDPAAICVESAWDIDPKIGTMPTQFQSFLANGNLVPVAFKQSVLQADNATGHMAAQRRNIQNQAPGLLSLLPFGGIQVPVEAVFLVLEVRRNNLLNDTARILQSASKEDLQRPLKVRFSDEEGVDEGGVAKEYFRLLSQQLFSPDYGMFLADPDSRYLWFNPGSFNDQDDFRLVGSVIGLAVYNNLPGLDVNFPPVLFKKLKGVQATMDDFGVAFPSQAMSLQAVLRWEPPAGLSAQEADQAFKDTFCLDFSVSFESLGETRTVHLLEGEDGPPPVGLARRREFAEAFKEWYLTTGIEQFFSAFSDGFHRVCSSAVYRSLSASDLEAIVCGEKDLDFEKLRKGSSIIDGAVAFRPGYLDEFWEIITAFDIVQKRQFLKFVTGSDLAPVGGLERLALKIQRSGSEPIDRLPTSQTCFNLLLLPEYADGAKLRRLLTTAIENAEGFGLQ